jgi:hypothetical protein
MGSPMVVLVFPLAQLLGQLGRAAENHSTVELVGVGSVAAFHLPVAFRTTSRDLLVRDAEIPQVPREVSAELGAVVGLNPLDCDGQSAANLLDELGRRLDGVMSIDAEHAIAGGFVDRRELVEPTTAELEVFDVDLDRLPRDVNLSTAPWSWTIPFQRHPGDAMSLQDPVDRWSRNVDLVVPLQKETDPERPVLALPANLKDQRDDMRWRSERVMPRSTRTVVEALEPIVAVPITPPVKQRP